MPGTAHQVDDPAGGLAADPPAARHGAGHAAAAGHRIARDLAGEPPGGAPLRRGQAERQPDQQQCQRGAQQPGSSRRRTGRTGGGRCPGCRLADQPSDRAAQPGRHRPGQRPGAAGCRPASWPPPASLRAARPPAPGTLPSPRWDPMRQAQASSARPGQHRRQAEALQQQVGQVGADRPDQVGGMLVGGGVQRRIGGVVGRQRQQDRQPGRPQRQSHQLAGAPLHQRAQGRGGEATGFDRSGASSHKNRHLLRASCSAAPIISGNRLMDEVISEPASAGRKGEPAAPARPGRTEEGPPSPAASCRSTGQRVDHGPWRGKKDAYSPGPITWPCRCRWASHRL